MTTDNNPNGVVPGQADPNNANKGDLRYCINMAASTGGTVAFDPKVFDVTNPQTNKVTPTTINLNAALTINNYNLNLNGVDPFNGNTLDITIAGNGSCRLFNLLGTSTVEIDNLTLAAGKALQADNNGDGGAIYDNAAGLTLTESSVRKATVFF